MIYRILGPFFLLCFTSQLDAQDISADTTDPIDHHRHHHDHHANEIGIAIAPVYFTEEETISVGLHLHYLRNITHSRFGFGIGYERIFDDHGHHTFGLVGLYRPVEKLSLLLSPGATFEDVNPGELHFALHFEVAYEFEIKNIHLGPVIEFAYDPEEFHISLGIHVGYGF